MYMCLLQVSFLLSQCVCACVCSGFAGACSSEESLVFLLSKGLSSLDISSFQGYVKTVHCAIVNLCGCYGFSLCYDSELPPTRSNTPTRALLSIIPVCY